nr:PKD domain-containing protein [Candidatus Omnitrophota bacterium]
MKLALKTSLTMTVLLFLFIFLLSFSCSWAQPIAPLTSSRCNEFTFDASNSYTPDKQQLSFFWDFGDGKTSTEPIVNYTYEKPGDYNVVLTITDNSGTECSTSVSTYPIRANIPPYASFVAPDMVCVNQPASFDASAS